MIPVETPKGTFRVWTKRIGNNPDVKVLLLHGGPGATHEYLEAFDSYFPPAGIEYYYYDQLGSYYSDQPDEPDLWELDRFVEEVEQVRLALGLNHNNFFLYGQSWGGMLAVEYALKYQQHLKGLIVSNMMASCPAYDDYAENVLAPSMAPDVLSEIRRLELGGSSGYRLAVTEATNKVSQHIFGKHGFVERARRSYAAHRFNGHAVFESIIEHGGPILMDRTIVAG